MRILWVKANKLLPVHSGGDIRSYHIARSLASRNELTFFSYRLSLYFHRSRTFDCSEIPGLCKADAQWRAIRRQPL
jgi:hypothetical protein